MTHSDAVTMVKLRSLLLYHKCLYGDMEIGSNMEKNGQHCLIVNKVARNTLTTSYVTGVLTPCKGLVQYLEEERRILNFIQHNHIHNAAVAQLSAVHSTCLYRV